MTIEEIAAIAVEEYVAGAFKPEMVERIVTRTLISKRESELMIEVIDQYIDQHQEVQ